MSFLVRDIMSSPPVTVGPSTTIAQAVELMRHHNVRHLPVVDPAHHPVGMISQRDLLSIGAIGLRNTMANAELPDRTHRVEDVMVKTIHVVRADEPAVKAASMILRNGYDGLPVTQHGRVVGVVTSTDFVRLVVEHADRFGHDSTQPWRD